MDYYDEQELETLKLRIKNLDTRMNQALDNINNTWAEINDLWMIVLEILKDLELLKVRTSDLEDRMDKSEKEIDQLFQEITLIWGDKTYYTGHNQYNIKCIWQKFSDLDNELVNINTRLDESLDLTNLITRITTLETNVTNVWNKIASIENNIDSLAGNAYDDIVIWGDQTYRNSSNQYNIKQIWQKLDTLDNNTVAPYDDTNIVNRITNLENNTIAAFNDTSIWGDANTKSNASNKNIAQIWNAMSTISGGTNITYTYDDSTIWGDANTKSNASNKNIAQIWNAMSTISGGNSTTITITHDDSTIWGDATTKTDASNKNITKIWQKLNSIPTSTAPVTITSGGSISPYDDSELRESIYSIWGNERYYSNGESSIKARNIKAIWNYMWDTIFGGSAYYNIASDRNIKAIWQKLDTLDNNTVAPYDDTNIVNRITNLENNTVTSYDDTNIVNRITNLENNTIAAFNDTSIWGDANTKSNASNKNIAQIWNAMSTISGGTNITYTYDDTNIKQSLQSIWGNSSYYNNSAKDIYHIWQKLDNLPTSSSGSGSGTGTTYDDSELRASITSIRNEITKINNALYSSDTNTSLITVGYKTDLAYTYEESSQADSTIVFHIHGVFIKIRDLGNTAGLGAPVEFCIQIMWNEANTNTVNNTSGSGRYYSYYWPSKGLNINLPTSFSTAGLAIVATDKAPLSANECQTMGACIIGKTRFGIERQHDDNNDPDYCAVSWNAIAIGY